MLEHLVKEHENDSYYISNKDPKFIEAYCETCGDSDTILASWNPLEKNAKLNALLRFLMERIINTREDIYNRAIEYEHYSRWYQEDIVSLLLFDISMNADNIYNMVSDLLDHNAITKNEFDAIMNISNFEEDRQIKMIKYFEKRMFMIDDELGIKVLKKEI